jgi:hypothetical protein
MATKAEIQAHIAKKLRDDVANAMTGAYVRDSLVEQVSIDDWNSIAQWLKDRNFEAIGQHIGALVRNTVVTDADSEAASILSDDVVDLTEYARIEGL